MIKPIELIFIGDYFYEQSKTKMSCIYDIHGGRCDWGFVQTALERGQPIHIRPATDAELGAYLKKLNALKAEDKNPRTAQGKKEGKK